MTHIEKSLEDYIKEGDTCAEVGVWKGEFSLALMEKNPSELHLIDPWIRQNFEKPRLYSRSQEEMDKIFLDVQKTFSSDKRVTIHRKFSIDAEFPENYFDWICIDANHEYKNVLEDLNHYWPMVKDGGFLCGDDYGWGEYTKCRRHGVTEGGPKRAVDEFIKTMGLELILIDKESPASRQNGTDQYVIPKY